MTEPPFEFLFPHDAERPYTVSEINDGISLILESHNTLVWVRARSPTGGYQAMATAIAS